LQTASPLQHASHSSVADSSTLFRLGWTLPLLNTRVMLLYTIMHQALVTSITLVIIIFIITPVKNVVVELLRTHFYRLILVYVEQN